MSYSPAVDHLKNPRKMGILENYTCKAQVKCDNCSDVVKMWVRIEDGSIADIRTQVHGCGFAITSTSAFNETVQGMPIAEAATVNEYDITEVIFDIPDREKCCVSLPVKCFQKILKDLGQE